MVVVMLQPFSSDASASDAISVLPRRMPCWSAKPIRMVSSFRSSATARSRCAASFCSADHSP
jgi:hypothetical protein